MDIKQILIEAVGSNVSIYSNSEGIRNTFSTGFSICGQLEKHNTTDCYRVVLSKGTYVYFRSKDLFFAVKHPSNFSDGSKYAFGIRIN